MNEIDKPFTRALLGAMAERSKYEEKPSGPTISIQGALRHLTAFYERIRTLIDYQEERFIRRLAIRRILIRRVLIVNEKKSIGESLLLELVRAAYLENNSIPVTQAAKVDEIIEKYLAATTEIEKHFKPSEVMRMQRRILGVAAAEIEDFLNPATIEYILTDRLAKEIADTFSIENEEISKMVALKGFLNADSELVSWRLLRQKNNPIWSAFSNNPAENAKKLAKELTRIEEMANKPEIETRVRQIHKLIPPYIVLADLAYQSSKETTEIADNPTRLKNFMETTIRRRLAHSEAKIQRSMIRATLYVFLSKVVLGLPVEIGYDLFSTGSISPFPLLVNTLIPPSLMITAALSLRQPSNENTIALANRTLLLFNDEPLPQLESVIRSRQSSSGFSGLFSFFFFATYLIVFGLILWVLHELRFNLVSSVVFFFFVSVVGFFAFRLRAAANELLILEEKEGMFLAIFDFFALPFLRLGRALSHTVQNFNVFLFFLDFIVEAPLKLVFVVLEDWFAFLREKREELQ